MHIEKIFIDNFLEDIFPTDAQSFYLDEDDEENINIIYNKNKINQIALPTEYMYNGYNFHIVCGVSKICFIFDDFDEVIKIPLSGECQSYYDDEDKEHIHFLNFINYLELEQNIYKVSDELTKTILLPNFIITYFNNIPIYIQNKAIVFTDCTFTKEQKNTPLIKRLTKELSKKTYVAPEFLQDIILYFGENKGQQIIENIIDFSDLHRGNYGYLKDGRPVIFDYGGFNESTC